MQETIILETERLRLRQLSTHDDEFILRLLNQPSFIQNIGDKGVRTKEDARSYILNGPVASYGKLGFGLWLVVLKDSSESIGICGLLKREVLDEVDLGYAFLPEFWSRGYALESASAVMSYAGTTLRLKKLAAVTTPDNESSIKLLKKIGFEYEKMVQLSKGAPEARLFSVRIKLADKHAAETVLNETE